MADDKKEKKEEKKEEKKDITAELGAFLVGLFFLSLVVERVSTYIARSRYGSVGVWWVDLATFITDVAWPIWKGVAVILVGLSVFFLFILHAKFTELNKEENEIYRGKRGVYPDLKEGIPVNDRWVKIMENMDSDNPSDWKFAIIEADVMLEEILRKSDYHGDTLGEMLKFVEKGDLVTLESAWEAHKIRNAIAHQGSGFDLTEREAKRAMSHFEAVFKEFGII